MNFRAKLLFSIGLLGLLCLILPAAARADTVYTYTGNAYNNCMGTYASTGSTCVGSPAITLMFDTSLSLSQLATLNDVNITAYVTSYVIADGKSVSIDGSGIDDIPSFKITTDAASTIQSWDIEIISSIGEGSESAETLSGFDSSDIFSPLNDNGGSIRSDPGTWVGGGSQPASTPEPSAFLLLGTGLFALLGLGRRRNSQTSGAIS